MVFRLEKLQSIVKKRKRVGRGGDRGGTSGRGGKGQTARSGGNPRLGYEGGQMPLSRRLPKRGFNNTLFRKNRYEVVNLESIEAIFEQGATITPEKLVECGLANTVKIKILARGELSKSLTVHAHAFSKAAEKAITHVGGKVLLTKEK